MATLRGTPTNDQLVGQGDDDEIFGFAGADRLTGGWGADRILGGAGNDQVNGGPGNDRISGGPGNDRLAGSGGNDTIFGAAGNDRIGGGPGADTLIGGPGADQFVYRAASEALDRITDFAPDQRDEIVLAGSLTGAAARMVTDGANTTVRVRTADAEDFSDLVVLEGFRQPIDVWYGDHQQFGDPGEAQRWVNILGNVSTTGLTSLTYTLNGGPEQPLRVGPNGSRLEALGDFNVEIDYNQLNPTPVDDLVRIRAAYAGGQSFTHDVTVGYEGGEQWPTDYSIDWAQVTDLQEVVQVVDGLWTFDADGARPALPGYDRVLALGDLTWDSYEAALTIAVHDLSVPNAPPGAAIWLGMQWGGHTDNPFGGQPHGGYIPGATFMLKGDVVILRASEFFPNEVNPRVGQGLRLAEGEVYNVLVRNERVAADTDLSDGLDRTYGIKVWGIHQPEPAAFAIQHTMFDQEPFGSFYLNAHYTDVTFGDVAIRELPSADILQGEDSLSALLAAAPAAEAPSGSSGGAPEPVPPSANLASLVATGDDPAVAA
jgi:RTX calcium-binding nonapeptide repeat (4 copies)